MPIIQSIILGLVQGLTEFIPVSSSGHLVVVPWLLGWEEPSVAFDTILHLGTLLAVLIYFWREWRRLLVVSGQAVGGLFSPAIRARIKRPDLVLLGLLVVGTIPALVIGYFFLDALEQTFHNIFFAGVCFIATGIFLVVVEWFIAWRTKRSRPLDREMPTWLGSLFIGLLQSIAILPAVSRSGLTIGGGVFTGLSRAAAARFSFLLAAPAILAAGVLGLFELQKSSLTNTDTVSLIVGFAVSALAGWAAIFWLLKFLRQKKLYVFAAYVIVFGGLILWLAKA